MPEAILVPRTTLHLRGCKNDSTIAYHACRHNPCRQRRAGRYRRPCSFPRASAPGTNGNHRSVLCSIIPPCHATPCEANVKYGIYSDLLRVIPRGAEVGSKRFLRHPPFLALFSDDLAECFAETHVVLDFEQSRVYCRYTMVLLLPGDTTRRAEGIETRLLHGHLGRV